MLSAAAVYDNYNGNYVLYSVIGSVILGTAESTYHITESALSSGWLESGC